MQSKQFAVAGIVTGAAITVLGVTVLFIGLAEAEQLDRDPVVGYDEVGTRYPVIEPQPLPSAPRPSRRPADDPTKSPIPIVEDEVDEPEAPARPPAEEAEAPSTPRASAEPAASDGPKPPADPTPTADPEPTPEPSDTAGPDDPSAEPTPTETATATP